MDADNRSADHSPTLTTSELSDELCCEVCGKVAVHFMSDLVPGTADVTAHAFCEEHVWGYLLRQNSAQIGKKG